MGRCLIIVAFAFLFVSGCHRAPKPLVGDWASNDPNENMVLEMRPDGTFSMLVGNQVGAGMVTGTYDLTANDFTLHMTGGQGGGNVTMSYKWVGPEEIDLSSKLDAGKSYRLKRFSTRPTAFTPGAGGSSATNPANEELVQATTCLSNVKQSCIASLLYAQDYDQRLPDATVWPDLTMAYSRTKAIYSCPTLQKAGKEGGYAMNSALIDQRMNSLPNPQSVPMIFEVAENAALSADPNSEMLNASRHGGKVSVGYADGHAGSLTK